MTDLNKQGLIELAYGATFLGSGGGGTLGSALEMIDGELQAGDSVPLVDADGLPKDGLTIACCYVGSQTSGASVTHVGALSAAVASFTQFLEKRHGKRVTSLVPLDLGVQSAVVPCALVAAQSGLSLVNGDGAGRGVPALMLTTFAAAFEDLLPGVAANAGGYAERIGPKNPLQLHNRITELTQAWGSVAGVAVWAIENSKLVSPRVVPRTLSLAQEIGQAISQAAERKRDLVKAVRAVLQANDRNSYDLFRGTVTRILATTADFATIELVNRETGAIARVSTAGENLLAASPGAILAMAPDLICWLKTDHSTKDDVPGPLSNTMISAGNEVALIGVSAPGELRYNDDKEIMLGFRAYRNWARAGAPYPLAPEETPDFSERASGAGESLRSTRSSRQRPVDDYIAIEELQLARWAQLG